MVRSQALTIHPIVVSVVLPVFNGAKYVLGSINSILNQTFQKFELIIVNDGSTDETANVLKNIHDLRIKVITFKKKRGIAYAINAGVSRANGMYIARMDSDDLSISTRLEEQVSFLKTHPNVALVGTWSKLINSEGKKVGEKRFPIEDREIRSIIIRFNPFIHPSIMVRKRVILEVGRYSQEYEGAEDYDMFLRICAKYRVANIPKLLIKFRLHSGSASFTELKRIEKQALRVRFHALKELGYPWWNYVYLIKPALAFLIPPAWKQQLLWP